MNWAYSPNFSQSLTDSIIGIQLDTDKKSITELVGESFSVMTMEESFDREDSFYIYEHEPLVDYELKILEMENNKNATSTDHAAASSSSPSKYIRLLRLRLQSSSNIKDSPIFNIAYNSFLQLFPIV